VRFANQHKAGQRASFCCHHRRINRVVESSPATFQTVSLRTSVKACPPEFGAMAADVRRDLIRRRLYYVADGEAPTRKGKAMRKKKKVADMVDDVLARQAKTRADRTGGPFEAALEALMGTEKRADALALSSSNKVPGPPVGVPRRGLR
jgi:hypothetical protein